MTNIASCCVPRSRSWALEEDPGSPFVLFLANRFVSESCTFIYTTVFFNLAWFFFSLLPNVLIPSFHAFCFSNSVTQIFSFCLLSVLNFHVFSLFSVFFFPDCVSEFSLAHASGLIIIIFSFIFTSYVFLVVRSFFPSAILQIA